MPLKGGGKVFGMKKGENEKKKGSGLQARGKSKVCFAANSFLFSSVLLKEETKKKSRGTLGPNSH